MKRAFFLLAVSLLAPALFAAEPATPGPAALPASKETLEAGAVGKVVEVKLKEGVVMKFCYCPAGNFAMGSPAAEKERGSNENLVPMVGITKGYWLGQTELTQEQWGALMGTSIEQQAEKGTFVKDLAGVGGGYPMYHVSWEEAQAYLGKLNETVALPAGWKFALPSEAQWEYACRAGTKTVFSFGDSLTSEQANFNGNNPYGTTTKGPYLGKTAPVGSYAANAWGLYDMHGNVWEWCGDWYAKELPGGADPTGAKEGVYRVYRGGSWNYDAVNCRAASRSSGYVPGFRFNFLGFRPALILSN